MSDTNNKISINVEINADGQQQINQYNKAFDTLRTSISNLSTPINTLNNDVSKLTNSINQLGSQNDSVVDTISKVKSTGEGLQTMFTGLKQALVIARGGVIAFEDALTGGLAVIITFLPEIIELTKSFFKGNESISTMAQNFKSLNEVMKTANEDAAEQTTTLNILYKSTTNVNNAHADRLKYANQLKAAYPEQFKNMKAEDIANGKAKKNYDDLTKSILASAKAKAALNKMTEESAPFLNIDYQVVFRKYNWKLAA